MEKQIRTTLILRNDTSANWAASSLVLKKGEVGFDTDLHIFKVGDGTKTWSQITTSFVDFAAVEKAIEDATKNLHTTDVFQGEISLGGDKAAKLEEIAPNPVKGDIGIIKEQILGDRYQYTAYVYNGENWAAMDGNYNVENVYFAEDLTYTADIGVLNVPSSGSGTIGAAGKNMKEVLSSILAKAQDPTITQPSVSIALSGAGAKEVGSEFTPSYGVKFNKGKYQYGPDTGITATYAVSDTASHTATDATGAFEAFTVGDTTNYKVNVIATHTEGAIPKNNLGSEVPGKKIAAGTKSASSGVVTGYRNSFWGGVKSKEGTPTSAIIRGLAGKKNGAISAGNDGDAQESVGDMRVIIAVPAPRTINSIKDVNGLNAEAFSAFTHITVDVEGANGYEAKSYNVYYKDNAAACDKANKWHFTVA